MNDWPVIPANLNYLDQEDACYISPLAETSLHGIDRSVILYGPPGSGKTTLMRRFAQAGKNRLFLVSYPLMYWPNQPDFEPNNDTHIDKIMACAAIALEKFIQRHPDRLQPLTTVNLEYLRWLLDKYLGPRVTRILADSIKNDALLALTDQKFQDLYPSGQQQLHLRGQIQELVTVARRLGFTDGVAVLVDIHQQDTRIAHLPENLINLFDWLLFFELEGFALKAAVPEWLVTQTNLLSRPRGRVTPIRLQWEIQDCREIADCHLAAESKSLEILAAPTLLADLEARLCITYGGPTPATWVQLAHHLLTVAASVATPVPQTACKSILRHYFKAHIPLKLDIDRRGVWRGAEFIALTEQPFSILQTLWHFTTRPEASLEVRDGALMRIAGKRGNLNTIARRLREKIEPTPNQPIYLHNTRADGYWLECVEPPGQ